MTEQEKTLSGAHDNLEGDADYIVISKSLFVGIVVGLVALLVGLAAGYFVGLNTANARFDDQLAALQEAIGSAGAANQAAAPVQPTQPPSRIDNVSVDDDPALGPEDAPITIVEFSDFRCPYCKRFHDEVLPQILETYGDQVRLVYRDFPVVGGQAAAEASECADDQGKYWEYHEALFADPQRFASNDDFVALAEELGLNTANFSTCLTDGAQREEIIQDYNDGVNYGVSGTPTFFVNGVRVIGAQPFSAFQQVIEEELGG